MAESKRYKFRGLLFWASNGLIRIEDQLTGEFNSITRKEALLRAKAINEEISNVVYGDEREELHRAVENLIEVVKEAKAQGDPTNPEVLRAAGKEIKRNRASRLLLPNNYVPGAESIPPIPMPSIPKLIDPSI